VLNGAVEQWSSRFTLAGVDGGDFARTVRGIRGWDDWLDGWARLGDEHAEHAREAEAARRGRTAGEAWVRAALAYHFARFAWTHDEARGRPVHERSVAALYAAHRHLDPTAERVDAPLDGATVVGNLRRPRGVERPALVLLIPGLDSTKEELFRFEGVVLDRGMAVLSLDGPGQGETAYALTIRADYEVAVTAVLDRLADREDLDLGRVGAIGVSFGGYYAPRAAALEPRIRAVAGLSGFASLEETWDDLPEPARETFRVRSGSATAREARAKAPAMDLRAALPAFDRPALFVTGDRDPVIPWRQTEQQAKLTPGARFVLVAGGDHNAANFGYRVQPMLADWMREQLG
jgi:2,6-dihydroxypseudooxynicotine hydrolase